MVAVRKNLSSRTGLWKIAGMNPSHKWLGYFRGSAEWGVNAAGATGRGAHARGGAMTEI